MEASSPKGPDTACLLVIPRHFYSFEKHIRQALESKGYKVTVSNDEYPEGMVGKILGKLQIPLIFPVTYKTITRKYLDGRHYDLVLIFKGRGMSERLIRAMHGSARLVIGYNWDSFLLNRAPLGWHKFVSRYFTFDYRDADRLNLPVIELFSSSNTMLDQKSCRYQLSSIVRNHGSRIGYIDKVLSILKPESAFISIYELNWITFVFNFLRSPRLYFKYRKYISFKPVPYTEYAKVMQQSEFTIDYAHDTQTGITMRCFEAINVKTKIITNNAYIRRSPHFNDADYIVFGAGDSPASLLDAYNSCRARPYASRPRTIADFVDELVAG